MAQTLETLTRRTSSMRGIRSVVHTMKTLSVLNAAPYERAAQAIEAYHESVRTGLHAFVLRFGLLGSVGPAVASAGTRVMIVFGSDHGLCGNYNEALAQHVAARCFTGPGPETMVLCIGAQMADARADARISVDSTLFPAALVDGNGRPANLLTQRLDAIRSAHARAEISVTLAYVARQAEAGSGRGRQAR